MSGASWKGSSIDELFNNSDKWSNQHIPITPSENQSVLFHLPFSDENHPPVPQRGTEVWDRDNVRLPCSSESFIAQVDENGSKILKSRWEIITNALQQPIRNSHELESAIKTYNEQYANVWNFSTLHKLFEQMSVTESLDFFEKLLPKMVELALNLPNLIKSPIPLLKQGMNRSISMSQQQAACLLANAFFCTFPYRNKVRKHSDYSNYPEISFNRLFGSVGQNVIEKLKCILNYFRRVLFSGMPCGVLTFFRKSKPLNVVWETETFPLSIVKYHISSTGCIEDASGMLQVDFANRFIGGGVLGQGCVQEEIRFVINPELIVAKLFTECLEENEAFLAIGCEQFNSYSGYASSFKFAGDFIDETPLDVYRRRKCRIIAINALNYSGRGRDNQFEEKSIRRDLNKAFVGFQSIKTTDAIDNSPVATGNWGCGAFNGYSIRAALIQLMACCLSQRNLAFFTFGDESTRDEIADLFEFLNRESVNVGKLYKILKQFQFDLMSDDYENLTNFVKKQIEINKEIEEKSKIESLDGCDDKIDDDDIEMKPLKMELKQTKISDFQTKFNPKPSTSSSSTKMNDFDRIENIFSPVQKSHNSTQQQNSVGEKRKLSLVDCLDSDYTNSK